MVTPAQPGTMNYKIHAIKPGKAAMTVECRTPEAAYETAAALIKKEWSLSVFFGMSNVTDKFVERFHREHPTNG